MQHTPTILVADSNGPRSSSLAATLRDAGYKVLSGPPENTPDVVLACVTDVPSIRGAQTVVLASHDQMKLAADCLYAGACGVVPDPVNTDLLLAVIRKACEKAATQRELTELRSAGAVSEECNTQCPTPEQQRSASIEAARQVMEHFSRAMSAVVEDAKCADYVAQLPSFVSLHDTSLKILAANTAYTDRFGVTSRSADVYQSHGQDGWISPVEETVRTGAPVRRCEPVLTASGEELPALIYTFPVGNSPTAQAASTFGQGLHDFVLEIAVDVSQVEEQQQSLLEARREYRRLFDESPCFITVQDSDLNVVDANRRFRDAFPYREGAKCYELYKHRHEPCHDCPIMRTFADGNNHQTETVVTDVNGQQMHLLVWTAPIRNAQGQITRVIEMATDITAIREMQDRLTSLGMMLGAMSHGTKGLLMAIDGGAYKIDSGIKKNDPERIVTGWEQVKEKLARLRKSTLDILYYTRSRELERSCVAVSALAHDLCESVRSKTERHGITLDCRIADDLATLPPLAVDEHALFSALINFLDNAVDACAFDRSKPEHTITFSVHAAVSQPKKDAGAHNGVLSVHQDTPSDGTHDGENTSCVSLCQQCHSSTALFETKADNDTPRIQSQQADHAESIVTFVIEDNGTGMDRETRDNMFTLFFSSKGAQGTGIGLFIAHQIITMHGGSIDVKSEVGTGTTFTVRLPLC